MSNTRPPELLRRHPSIGLAFLARGLHPDWEAAFDRFLASYEKYPAGIEHRFYVIFKGYRDPEHLRDAERRFARIAHVPIHLDDRGLDIGAYKKAALIMAEDLVCFLNTKSEILCPDWLRNLAANLERPGVGLVGNTGSFETHHPDHPVFPDFPNVHIRTNGFLIERRLLCSILEGFEIDSKFDSWMVESGPAGLSRQVIGRGMKILVVGRDGNAYEPSAWPSSGTFRSGSTRNVLIADDDYRFFLAGTGAQKAEKQRLAWGPYLDRKRAHEIDRHVDEIARTAATPRRPGPTGKTVARNEPCPCGSGHKFKHCHGSYRDPDRDLLRRT